MSARLDRRAAYLARLEGSLFSRNDTARGAGGKEIRSFWPKYAPRLTRGGRQIGLLGTIELSGKNSGRKLRNLERRHPNLSSLRGRLNSR